MCPNFPYVLLGTGRYGTQFLEFAEEAAPSLMPNILMLHIVPILVLCPNVLYVLKRFLETGQYDTPSLEFAEEKLLLVNCRKRPHVAGDIQF